MDRGRLCVTSPPAPLTPGSPTAPAEPTTWRSTPGRARLPRAVCGARRSDKTYSWNTTGLALGQYGLRVDARDVGAVADYETVATAYYNLADPPCATPTVAISPVSPQGVGTMITFTTTTTNCPRPLYEFWMLPPGTTNWILGQGYSTNPSWRWNSTGAPPGDY